jgi:hypothetical protein
MLASAFTLEPLKPIARWNRKVHQIAHPIDLVQFAASNRPQ